MLIKYIVEDAILEKIYQNIVFANFNTLKHRERNKKL